MPGDPPPTPSEVARKQRGMRLLSGAMNDFAEATSDYPRLLESVARNVAEAIGDSCLVLLVSPDGRSLEPAAVYDADPEVRRGLLALFDEPLTLDRETMARDVMLSGEPVCIPALDMDAFERRTTPPAFALHRAIGTHGLLIVPLRVRGEPLGSLSIVRRRAGHPALDAFDVEVAHDLAKHAALAISNARLLRRAQEELARRYIAEQSALFLDAIVENIPDMVFVKDAENLAFTRFNRAGEELLGIPRERAPRQERSGFLPRRGGRVLRGEGPRDLARQVGRRHPRGADPDAAGPEVAPHEEGADRRPRRRGALSPRHLARHHRSQARDRGAPRGEGGGGARQPRARGVQLLGRARSPRAAPRDRRLQPGAPRRSRRVARRGGPPVFGPHPRVGAADGAPHRRSPDLVARLAHRHAPRARRPHRARARVRAGARERRPDAAGRDRGARGALRLGRSRAPLGDARQPPRERVEVHVEARRRADRDRRSPHARRARLLREATTAPAST